jgi:hypothetical protein
MSSKKMTISLDGKELTLNFGIGRFYHLFKESTGYDLLDLGKGFDSTKMVDIVQGLVYAGYVAEKKLNKQTPELSKESIYDSVLDCDVAKIFKDFNDLMNPETLGEQNGQLKEVSILST